MIELLAALITTIQITVCPTCEIRSIQTAINLADTGSTIVVQSGTYLESNLLIDKTLQLRGVGRPIIDGKHSRDVIKVFKADRVEISGFEIINSGKSYTEEFSGIKVEESSDCIVRDNRLHDNNFGIYLANTHRCLVEVNVISGVVGNEADTGNGIHIWQGDNERILNNDVSGQRDGIYFEFVNDSVIEDNRSCDNLRYGLHFMFSNSDSYRRNYFCQNGSGVAVMYSRDIEMIANRFVGHSGPAAYGLLLKEIGGATISDNEFRADSIGIYMEGSNRGRFRGNQFFIS